MKLKIKLGLSTEELIKIKRISELEDRSFEITQSEKRSGEKEKEREQRKSLRPKKHH